MKGYMRRKRDGRVGRDGMLQVGNCEVYIDYR